MTGAASPSPTDFGRCLAVVVIGQDGLVANTAKYAGDLPIIGVNPDPARNDGVLLPFKVSEARSALRRAIDEQASINEVTLAEVNTNDGQRMLAFNDFFIGAASHVSARYTLDTGMGSEQQSSSGVIISTGAGSTGWLSSLFNMTAGISRLMEDSRVSLRGDTTKADAPFAEPNATIGFQLAWDDRRLVWVVREPFRSKQSSVDQVAGFLDEAGELVIGSQMPTGGVIFSDSVETDYLEFSSGMIARFLVSPQRAGLVVG